MTEAGVIDTGIVVVDDDSILAVQKFSSMENLTGLALEAISLDSIPVFDLHGGSVIPGLIDMHSSLGLEYPRTGKYTEKSVLQYFLPGNRVIGEMLRSGITTVALRPPVDSLFSGYSALVKLLPDTLGGFDVVNDTLDFQVSLDGKAIYSKDVLAPAASMERLFRFREFLTTYYAQHRAETADPAADSLVAHGSPYPEKNIPLYILANRAIEILEVNSLFKEYHVQGYFGGVADIVEIYHSWMDQFSPQDPYINGIVLGPQFFHRSPENHRFYPITTDLEDLDIIFAVGDHFPKVHSLSLIDRIRNFIRYGLTEQQALETVTTVPSKIVRQYGKLGIIAPGADADLVCFSSSPFEFNSRNKLSIVNGKMVWFEN